MPYDPERHHRRSIRLAGYDYTQPGAYFITICVQGRECRLGRVKDGQWMPFEAGTLAEAFWRCLPDHYSHVQLDAFCVMPNHVHGILILTEAGYRGSLPPPRPGIPQIVGSFKKYSARAINRLRGVKDAPFWQRGYYEHIIRTEVEWASIVEYITRNPANWQSDSEFIPDD